MTELKDMNPEELHKLDGAGTATQQLEINREKWRRIFAYQRMKAKAEEQAKTPESWADDVRWGRHMEALAILATEAEEGK